MIDTPEPVPGIQRHGVKEFDILPLLLLPWIECLTNTPDLSVLSFRISRILYYSQHIPNRRQ